MNRQYKKSVPAIVPIAKASSATRGAWGRYRDEILMQEKPGLTND